MKQTTTSQAEADKINKNYIVVEGPIGVGKTTLTHRIAKFMGAAPIVEKPEENPFLERFYKDPRQYALQTQLYFLFQRVRQLRELRQGDLFSPVRVSDFMLDKDPLFARITLDDDELDLYEKVYRNLAAEAPVPDLVIYLQAPTDVLISRIRRRGVLFERNMERAYLERLVDSYLRYFLGYRDSPLLMVNAERLNFADNDEHCEMVFEQIRDCPPGRNYFNPEV